MPEIDQPAPIPPLPPTSSVTTQLASHGKPFLPVTAVAAILLISSLAFGAYQIGKNRSPSPTAEPPTVPSTDPTANWKAYINEEMGFSLKYPTDRFVKVLCKEKGGPVVGLWARKPEYKDEEVVDESCGVRADKYTLGVTSSNLLSPREFESYIQSDKEQDVSKKEIITQGGLRILKYKIVPKPHIQQGSYLYDLINGSYALVSSASKTFHVTYFGEDSGSFDQILATFKFL